METIHLSLFVMLCLGVHNSSSEILQRQKRNWIIDSFEIDEGYEGPFPYMLGKIDIEKDFVLFKIHGQGVDEEPEGVLQINEYEGTITVHRPVDREKNKVLKLMFQAIDRQSNVVDTQLGIEILITDANDNPPRFDKEMYEISIKELTTQDTEVITVRASDVDDSENNKRFDLKIVSVTPQPHDLEFYLTQLNGVETGTISFNGCLDYERAEKYTIIVEAKDHGVKKQLSSSCTIVINIEDGNNHIPEITGQIGPSTVKEREENVLVTRLQVTDKDTRGTPAWRAKFSIHGDTGNNFRITTDPETNEGLLYVDKHLDFEDGPLKNLTISVENEIPYHTCKVVKRTHTGRWKVTTIGGTSSTHTSVGGMTGVETLGLSTHRVTVSVEDENEPPIFDNPDKQVTLVENIGAGHYLETFEAKDPDVTSANTFEYKIGNDPAGWITVDPLTGRITTSKTIDRESPFVNNSIYVVTVCAVDNGEPSMTATATLSIYVSDENDNFPTLAVSTFDICQSNGPSLVNITAMDLDGDPYSGPFKFNLLGDVEGKWRLDPSEGTEVSLVKESTVHSGHFELLLEVSDRQYKSVVHNLSVTVCDCINSKQDCSSRKAVAAAVGVDALGILFLSILLFAGLLLLAILLTCKKPVAKFPVEASGHLIDCNTEKPGTDCTVDYYQLNQGHNLQQIQPSQIPITMLKVNSGTTAAPPPAYSEHAMSQTEQQQRNNLNWFTTNSVKEASQDQYGRKSFMERDFTPGNSMRWSTGTASTMRTRLDRNSMRGSMHSSSTMRMRHQDEPSKFVHKSMRLSSTMRMRHQDDTSNSTRGSMRLSSTMRMRHQDDTSNSMHGIWMRGGTHSADIDISAHHHSAILLKVLNTMLNKIYVQEEELGEDILHVYAEEEEKVASSDLDVISIPDISFNPDTDLDVNCKFNTLASICTSSEIPANSTVTTSVMEELETATLIQVEAKNCHEHSITSLKHI